MPVFSALVMPPQGFTAIYLIINPLCPEDNSQGGAGPEWEDVPTDTDG
jgi:hypothetical protein